MTHHRNHRWVLGIDIGGTFTDGFAIREGGETITAKVPTTSPNGAIGALACVSALALEAGVSLRELLEDTIKFSHAQTATVNAMVQRRGARTGLITTKGFRDTLAVMNVSRGVGLPLNELADSLRGDKAPPLVPHHLTLEVSERVDRTGAVLTALDEEEARSTIAALLDQGVETIAVCLLWSFQNPEHERLIRRVAVEMAPEIPITLSSDIAPVIGEYERTFTTVANAYLGPALGRYVHELQDELSGSGLSRPVLIMQSNGGLIPAAEASSAAVTTMVSGLAGGAMGSAYLAGLLGMENVISADMGGTSFEVSLIVGSKPQVVNYALASRLGPYLWRWKTALPTIEVTAIGAGGGSIASLDDGVLKIGPRSAEATPGPACYGTGGVEPTVTDADLVLGYLNPDYFLGGRMKAYKDKAEAAIYDKIAEPLGISVIEAAKGIIEVANNQMADLMRNLTIHKGHDPRDFHLVAFGGAGPLHVGSFGPELGVKGMVIPGAGLAAAYSALGVALADFRQVFVHSVRMRAPFDPDALAAAFEDLELRATETFHAWGLDDVSLVLGRSADMRYARQFHAVEVALESGLKKERAASAAATAFERQYEKQYGRGTAVPEAGIEITNVRVTAVARATDAGLLAMEDHGPASDDAIKGVRDVHVSGGTEPVQATLYAGELLTAGNRLSGPSIIEYAGTTVFVNTDQTATIDAYLNCAITSENRDRADKAPHSTSLQAGCQNQE